jgi:fibronectin type 3 domain-containing protein
VTLTWTAAPGATTYFIARGTSRDSGYTSTQVVTSPSTTFVDNDPALVNGTTYYYRISANNGVCVSITPPAVSATPSAACTQAVPTGVTASTTGSRQVTLTWTAAPGATRYEIGRSPTSGSGYATVGNTTAPTTTYVDSSSNLVNGTTYYYVVRAYNESCGSDNSAEVSALPSCLLPSVPADITATANSSAGSSSGSTYFYSVSASNAGGTCSSADSSPVSAVMCRAPSVPTDLSAAPAGSGEVTLTWSAASNAGSYEILRSTISGSGYVSVGTSSTTSFTDNGLTNGTTYYYVIRALNGGAVCASANSAQSSAKPQGCQGLLSTQSSITIWARPLPPAS